MIECWDVYDVNGTKLGYTKRSDEEFCDGEYHIGASAWIVNSKGKLLIQKRAASKQTYPNVWSITGGKVRAGERSILACIREVKEEIGLMLSEHDLTFLYRSIGSNMLFDDYIAIINDPIDKERLRTSEVSEIKWTSIEEILFLFDHNLFLYNNISDLSMVQDFLCNYFNSSQV